MRKWLLPIALLAGLFVVFGPLRDWRTSHIASRASAIEERARLSQSLAALELAAAQLSGTTPTDLTWDAPRAGEVDARVQAAIDAEARAAGMSVRAITPVGRRDMPYADGIVFRLEGEAPLDRLSAFLRAIEYTTPPLVVDRATLRRLIRPDMAEGQPVLFAQLDILAPVRIGDAE